MDIRIMTKGASGEYEAKYVNETSLVDWFKSHVDEDGNVTEDIVVYQQCEIDRKADRLAIVMTDFSIDRDQERIDPAGWDLKNYKRNPVILWGHDSKLPSIGHMSRISKRKEDGALVGIPDFSPQEVDQFGWMIGEKLKRGDLNAGSVGICSKKVEIVEDEKEDARLIHRKQELYEFSIVNIPSNTNAVTVRLDAEPDEEKDTTSPDANWLDYLKNDTIKDAMASARNHSNAWPSTKLERIMKEHDCSLELAFELNKAFSISMSLKEIKARNAEPENETVIPKIPETDENGILLDTEAFIDEDITETAETKLSYLDELFKENESSSPRAGQETTDLMHMFKDSDTKHTLEELLNAKRD